MALPDSLSWAGQYLDVILQNDLLTAGALLIASVIGAKLLYFIIVRYLTQLTKATKTTLDDELVAALQTPIYFLAITLGVYFSLLQVEALLAYKDVIHRILLIFLIILATYTVARLLVAVLGWYDKEVSQRTGTRVSEHFMPAIRKIIYIFIYALGFVIILDQLGVKVTALIASLGVVSLAVALALQDTLSNFFAGFYIMADKPFKPGDLVKLETGEEGVVSDIGWRSTRLKLGQNLLIVPNNKLSQSRIINYSLPIKEVTFSVGCATSYKNDLEKVEQVTLKVAREVLKAAGVRNFEPSFRFTGFGESNVMFSVVLMSGNGKDKGVLNHEFIKQLMKEFRKEGLEISLPVRRIYTSKG